MTEPIPAATVVVARDAGDAGDGIEVLMLRRNSRGAFGGMWVFPGGQVDPEDEAGDEMATARRAAVREAREESGLTIDPGGLVPFSHWIPPPQAPKRFSTWFFLAPAPAVHDVSVDGAEIHDHEWRRPADAVALRDAGEIELAPPTWVTLWRLAQAGSVDDAVAQAVRRATESLGGLDIGVLNAGVGGFSMIEHMSTEEWDRVHRVNLRAVFVGVRECAKAMTGGGAIVATASTSGFLAERGFANYSTSKAAVIHLVRVAARELGVKGIRVNAVAPGTTDTPMFAGSDALPGYRDRAAARTALGRIGTPDDVAEAVIALLRLEWVTGQTLVADGGLSLYSPVDPME